MVIRLKVLMITQNFYPEIGSASNRATNIYSILKAQGHQVTVLTTEPNYPNRNLYKNESFWDREIPEIDIVRIRLKTRKYTSNLFKRLIYYLEMMLKFVFYNFKLQKSYDVVFATSPSIFIGIAGVVAKRKQKSTLILDIRDLWPETMLGIKKFNNPLLLKMAYGLERYLYNRADKITINSEEFTTYMIAHGVPREKLSFIPNALTEEELERKDKPTQNESSNVKILYAGNVGLAQDVETLIEIAQRLKTHQNIEFELVGYGFSMKDIEQKIADRNLKNIIVSSAINRKQTLDKIFESDIVYATLMGSDVFKTVLPGKVIDYMGLGKVIVANASGYCASIIKSANCGLVSETGNLDELCGFILRLAESPQLRFELGKNGHHYAKAKFNWAINSKTLLEVFKK